MTEIKYRILYYKYSGKEPEIIPIDNIEAAILFIHRARESMPSGGAWQLEYKNNYDEWYTWLNLDSKDVNQLILERYPDETEPNDLTDHPYCKMDISNGKPVTVSLKQGRNDPCVCGSGKKYKKCCGG